MNLYDNFSQNVIAKCELDVPEIACLSRVIEDNHTLSFQKILKDPDKHQGIIVKDTVVFLGADDNYPHLSLENAIKIQNEWFEDNKPECKIELPKTVALLEFVPSNTNIRKKGKLSKGAINLLEKYAGYRQQGCDKAGRKIKVVSVDGTCKHIRTNVRKKYKQGQRVTTETAEYYVKDHLEVAQKEGYEGVWIVASVFCQRSFTVGETYIVMLSYDGGHENGTVQKASRISSPYRGKTAGLIISNSFNPARDEKIDSMLVNRTIARQNRTGDSFANAGRKVKRGLSIFSIDDNGDGVQWEWDEYMSRLAKQKDMPSFRNNIVRALLEEFKNAGKDMILMQGVRDKGHTAKIRLDPTYTPDEDESKIKREARQHKNKKDSDYVKMQVLKHFVKNIDLIHDMGTDDPKKCIVDVLSVVNNTGKIREEFIKQFGIDPTYFYDVYNNNPNIQKLTEFLISVIIIRKVKEETKLIEDYCFDEEKSI